MQKSDDHVGNLDSGIVDVVLNVHVSSGKTQQADKSIAQDGIAQMADMRGFVGIDAGVLNQNLARWSSCVRGFAGSERGGKLIALDARR